jgi:hypothetical protein
VIALADGLCDLRGEITSAEGLRDWGRRAVPLLNYTLAFALQLRKSTENLSQGRSDWIPRAFPLYTCPGTVLMAESEPIGASGRSQAL